MFSFKKKFSLASTHSNPSWLRMVFNKIRRSYLCYFRPEYVKQFEASRLGECFGCGKCCTLVFKCVFLSGSDEQARCRIYNVGRPKPCGAFPIDPKDLADVNFLCGYSFLPESTVVPSPAKPPKLPVVVPPPMEPSYQIVRRIEPAVSGGDLGRFHPALPMETRGQRPMMEVNLMSE